MNYGVNLGCGCDPRQEGIINVDIREMPNVDVVSDLRKLPFENEQFEYVRSYYAIEHFARKEIDALLEEWKRLVRPGGLLEITTCDWEALMDKWREIPWEDVLDGLYGAQNYEYDFHKVGFVPEELGKRIGWPYTIEKWETRGIPRFRIKAIKK